MVPWKINQSHGGGARVGLWCQDGFLGLTRRQGSFTGPEGYFSFTGSPKVDKREKEVGSPWNGSLTDGYSVLVVQQEELI